MAGQPSAESHSWSYCLHSCHFLPQALINWGTSRAQCLLQGHQRALNTFWDKAEPGLEKQVCRGGICKVRVTFCQKSCQGTSFLVPAFLVPSFRGHIQWQSFEADHLYFSRAQSQDKISVATWVPSRQLKPFRGASTQEDFPTHSLNLSCLHLTFRHFPPPTQSKLS